MNFSAPGPINEEPLKNQYIGDLGDFAKYGLLRAIAGFGHDRAFRLGVRFKY